MPDAKPGRVLGIFCASSDSWRSHCGIFKNGTQRQINLEAAVDASKCACDRKRIGAKFKEIIVYADGLNGKHLLPDFHRGALVRSHSWRTTKFRGFAGGLRTSGAGKRRVSIFPFGVKGKLLYHHEMRWNHVSRQLCPKEEVAQRSATDGADPFLLTT